MGRRLESKDTRTKVEARKKLKFLPHSQNTSDISKNEEAVSDWPNSNTIESDTPNNGRQVARYLRKARQIAADVAQGQFPGAYE